MFSTDMEPSEPGPGPGPGPGPRPGPRPGPAPSSVSLKSDSSRNAPPTFKEARPEGNSTKMDLPGRGPGLGPGLGLRPGPAPSSVSLKSDNSKNILIEFREDLPEKQRDPDLQPPTEAQLNLVFTRLEQDVLRFVQQQLQKLHRLLASDYPECSESEEEEQSTEVLNITLDFLKKMDQEHLAQRLQNSNHSQTKCF
ncbi:hypothetical protein WMY93_026227 [Mugilogobius chulae]|uniref:Uncharacterized protein n=1 Tax=Mugilogobius chulae TaxID=88201 RepID=A0AAW0MWZ8_9GOBI